MDHATHGKHLTNFGSSFKELRFSEHKRKISTYIPPMLKPRFNAADPIHETAIRTGINGLAISLGNTTGSSMCNGFFCYAHENAVQLGRQYYLQIFEHVLIQLWKQTLNIASALRCLPNYELFLWRRLGHTQPLFAGLRLVVQQKPSAWGNV